MQRVFRHDVITLQDEAQGEDFEKFMRDELMPYFSGRYRGPTRASIADLKSQSLLKDIRSGRKWLWVTVWEGRAEAVRQSSFEDTRIVKFEETRAMLKRLAAFGRRSPAQVFGEVESVEVETNR